MMNNTATFTNNESSKKITLDDVIAIHITQKMVDDGIKELPEMDYVIGSTDDLYKLGDPVLYGPRGRWGRI